jgi:hypothetical protein
MKSLETKKPKKLSIPRVELVKLKQLKNNKLNLVQAMRRKAFNNPLVDEKTTYSVELEFSANKKCDYFQEHFANFATSFTYDGSITTGSNNDECNCGSDSPDDCSCDFETEMLAHAVEARINCFNGHTGALKSFLQTVQQGNAGLNEIRCEFDDSCGMHISIKSIDEVDKATKRSRLVAAIQLFYLMSPESRRRNDKYCRFTTKNIGKYSWLNTSNEGRLEARFPAMSFNLNKIDLTARLILFVATNKTRFDQKNEVKALTHVLGLSNGQRDIFITKLKKYIIKSEMPSDLIDFIELRLNKFKRRDDKPVSLKFFSDKMRMIESTKKVGVLSCVA